MEGIRISSQRRDGFAVVAVSGELDIVTSRRFDEYLASDAPLACEAEQLFQGPIADALNHVGQIALLRRLAGAPIRAENYYRAEITRGRVGMEQTPPRREFD